NSGPTRSIASANIAGQSQVTTAPIPTEVRSWDGGKAPMTDEEKKIERQIETEYHAKFPNSRSLIDEKNWINQELIKRGYTHFRVMEVLPPKQTYGFRSQG